MDRGHARNDPLTLPHLVPVPENRLALAAVHRLGDWFGSDLTADCPWSLLYLHGPPGSGKTHLVSALATATRQRDPGARIAHWTAADLRQPAVPAPESELELGDEGRTADLLILEDLQHLPVQAACGLCQLLDERQNHELGTVLTATTSPWQLTTLPQRCTSRLAAGLVVRLAPLTPPSRLAILERKVQLRQLALAPAVLNWLAHHLHGNGRQLDAALDRVSRATQTRPRPLDEAAVAELFREQIKLDQPRMERIIQGVSRHFQVDARQLVSRRRHHQALWPRQMCMYLARQLTGLSLSAIGAHFGGRDHSTVLHACQKVEQALERDEVLASTLRLLQTELG